MHKNENNLTANVLYVHGFNSSPRSLKAQLTQQYLAQHHPEVNFHCPQLATSPKAIIEQLQLLIETPVASNNQAWFLIGSSLGGYFSTYLAHKYQLSAALINPAVKPYQLMQDIIGLQTNPYTNETYQVTSSHVGDLKTLEQDKLVENNYLVMLQTGDEVLDYRQAEQKYQQCRLIVQQGGDHSFIDYQDMLPEVIEFFGLA